MGVFWNAAEERMRAGWRVLLQYLLYVTTYGLIAGVVAGALLSFGIGSGQDSAGAELWALAASAAAALGAAAGTVWLAGRLLDRRERPLRREPLDGRWWSDLGFGLLLGGLLMSGIFSVEAAAGWIEVSAVASVPAGAPSVLAVFAPVFRFACAGIAEELIFRAYQIRNLAEGARFLPGIDPKAAVLIGWVASSLIFGIAHGSNPNASLLGTVNVAAAGIMLGAGYVLTGRLALPIGLHVSWNLFQGNVFSFPVSGLEPAGATVLTVEQHGQNIWTGGAFGPEGGLLGLAAFASGTVAILLWVRLTRKEGALVSGPAHVLDAPNTARRPLERP
ncbi:MAG: CPBP family intramembrane metalloprotease [Actinomycetota bacterium]|nr:CPBP family intramembrane metalloprotease [Actinomycetota bacterium]